VHNFLHCSKPSDRSHCIAFALQVFCKFLGITLGAYCISVTSTSKNIVPIFISTRFNFFARTLCFKVHSFGALSGCLDGHGLSPAQCKIISYTALDFTASLSHCTALQPTLRLVALHCKLSVILSPSTLFILTPI
jgi:hypothetical protein